MVRSPRFPLRKGTDKLYDAVPKIHWQSENGSELDHNRVHFPEAIVQVDVQERFTNAQMRGRLTGRNWVSPSTIPRNTDSK